MKVPGFAFAWLVVAAAGCKPTRSQSVVLTEDGLAFVDVADATFYRPDDLSGRYLEPAKRGIPLSKGQVFPLVDVVYVKDGACAEIKLPSGKHVFYMGGSYRVVNGPLQ